MSNLSLDFLQHIRIEEVQMSAPRVTRKELNPAEDFMGIRVWKDGSVYPSKALVERFSLEYPKVTVEHIRLFNEDGTPKMIQVKGENGEVSEVQETKRRLIEGEAPSFGLDVFQLSDWTQADANTRSRKLILVAVSPKNAGKVELFAQVNYNDDGTPKTSVMEQGATTFGKEKLIPMLKECYGTALSDETPYADLEIVVDQNLRALSPNGIFLLPKTIVRGKDAGKMDYMRRENVDIFPMVVAQPVQEPATTQSSEPAVNQSVPESALLAGTQA